MRRASDMRIGRALRGFTLVEIIAVMSITAVIAAGVAVFLRMPLQAYQDAQRRASISDAADTVFTQLRRDLQTALPNSVRVTSVGGVFHLEFLQVRTAGRYRSDAASPPAPSGANSCPDANADGFADENVLRTGIADTCFTTIGPILDLAAITAADYIAVYNLGVGFPNADAYASGAASGGNKSLVTAVAAGAGGENVIRFQANTFTLDSPARRFYVVSGPVSYTCDPTAGTLARTWNYPITAAQPTPPAGTSSLLAHRLTACSMTYDQNVVNQRNGIVSLRFTIADPAGGAATSLFQQVQVSNEP